MTQKEAFYFTFGVGDEIHRNHYVRLVGTYHTTRARMVALFGRKWAFQYDERQFAGQPERYGLSELRID